MTAAGSLNIRLIAAIVAIVLFTLLIFWDRDKIFTFEIKTESISFTITDSDSVLSRWQLEHATLISDPFKDTNARNLDDFSLLMLARGTQVRIQRHGLQPAHIRLQKTDGESIGRLIGPSGEPEELGDWVSIRLTPSAKPVILPFRGQIIVGEDVAPGVDSVLLNGRVSVIEAQIYGKTHYVAGTQRLESGDRVSPVRDRIDVSMDGFVRIDPVRGFADPTDGLMLIAHGEADYVRVDRLGSAGYEIRASPWARFEHDPTFVAFLAILPVLVLLLQLLKITWHARLTDEGKHDAKTNKQTTTHHIR